VTLITESWRLKLLAVGLSVLMLGAVAFAQNPPTFRTLTVSPIQYTIPDNLIVLNAPTRTTVTVTGLADAIQSMNASSLTASFDLTKARPGACGQGQPRCQIFGRAYQRPESSGALRAQHRHT